MARMDPRRPAPTPEPAPAIDNEYPMALYKGNSKQPSGYNVRRVANATDEAKLIEQGWKNSPEEL